MDTQTLRWAPIVGRWDIAEDRFSYNATTPALQRPFGILISNNRFSEGTFDITIELTTQSEDTSGRILLGYRSPEEVYYTVGLGGYGAAYVISRFDHVTGWSRLA